METKEEEQKMPTTYAHDLFGKRVYRRLPEKLQHLIRSNGNLYRIGQTRAVTVYHLVSQHTIEEKIIRLHESKRELAENILAGTDISHKLTGKDLLEMIRR